MDSKDGDNLPPPPPTLPAGFVPVIPEPILSEPGPSEPGRSEPGPSRRSEPGPSRGSEPGPSRGSEPGRYDSGPSRGSEPGRYESERGRSRGSEPGRYEPGRSRGSESGRSRGSEPGRYESEPGRSEPGPSRHSEPGRYEPGPSRGSEPGRYEPGPSRHSEPGRYEPGHSRHSEPGRSEPGPSEPGPSSRSEPGPSEAGPSSRSEPGPSEAGPSRSSEPGPSEPGPSRRSEPGPSEPGPSSGSEAGPSKPGPSKVDKKPKFVPMVRPGLARKGKSINLLTNHFKASINKFEGELHHYNVDIFYEDGSPCIAVKDVGRKVLHYCYRIYGDEMPANIYAYDGDAGLFTYGILGDKYHDFKLVLVPDEARSGRLHVDPTSSDYDPKRYKRPEYMKKFRVRIKYTGSIPVRAIGMALRGHETEHSREAMRVLDIALRQSAANKNCLLIRQSFFHYDPVTAENINLGGGIQGVRGFHSSFRATDGGLFLNMDASITTLIKQCPLDEFILEIQGLRDKSRINLEAAMRTIKNLWVRTMPTNREYRIKGLSPQICDEQIFNFKRKSEADPNEVIAEDISVTEYYMRHRKVPLHYSRYKKCIDVGRPNKPTYIPLELCHLLPLQRYKKALTVTQRTNLVDRSRQRPRERMDALREGIELNNYDREPLLRELGLSINPNFTKVQGRVLQSPQLALGNGESIFPRNGRWNFNNKKFIRPIVVGTWAVAVFGKPTCDVDRFIETLGPSAINKGLVIERPRAVIFEQENMRRAPPITRVDNMIGRLEQAFKDEPKFLLCFLPESKNSELYGPWKKKCLSDMGIMTQCVVPKGVKDQYVTNVLLKINAKLGGLNSMLRIEHQPAIPLVSKTPTIILGLDVTHGQTFRGMPSIAAVVSSLAWPLISKYRASVRTQSEQEEIIQALFQPSGENDTGMIKQALLEFYYSSNRRPEQMIIFRDGVSESQFNQVLNIELDQIIQACNFMNKDSWCPKITLIVAQKNHHTRFFLPDSADNVPPGTVVDNTVCHPLHYDFYMCSQAGLIGTTRPTHYHVLYDEIKFSPDDLQELVHSLSYVYQRSTTSIAGVAPICYAHQAAYQMGQFVKFDDESDSNSVEGAADAPPPPIQQLPEIKKSVKNSMFFC